MAGERLIVGSGRNAWVQILVAMVPMLPMLVLGGIALITMRNELTYTQRQLGGKANIETVQIQYQAILRELEAVNRRLDRIERAP